MIFSGEPNTGIYWAVDGPHWCIQGMDLGRADN